MDAKIIFDVTRMELAQRENLVTMIGSICGFYGADFDCRETLTAVVEPGRAADLLAQLAKPQLEIVEADEGPAEAVSMPGSLAAVVADAGQPGPDDDPKCEICGGPIKMGKMKNRKNCGKPECKAEYQRRYFQEKKKRGARAFQDVAATQSEAVHDDDPFGSEGETWVVETGPARGQKTNLAHLRADREFYMMIQGEMISHPSKGLWMIVPQVPGPFGKITARRADPLGEGAGSA